MSTIAESISRIRNGIKAVREEAFITDRYIYSVILKYGKTLIERETKLNSIFKNDNIFVELPYVELRETSTIDNCYVSIDTGCTIMKSVNRIPKISSIKTGPLIRYVSTLDHSIQLKKTTPDRYAKMKNLSSFKYNKDKYYWIIDDYIYVPDIDWDAICISAVFEGDTSGWLCDSDDSNSVCKFKQDSEMSIPEYLLAEAEQMARQEILPILQIPVDSSTDKQNISR